VAEGVMGLRVQRQICGDVSILACDGRIVYGEYALLHEQIISMLLRNLKIVLNLEGVIEIDSQGLGMLAGLLISARNRGGDLKLATPNERVKELFQRTGLHSVFKVYEKSDDAVAAFDGQAVT